MYQQYKNNRALEQWERVKRFYKKVLEAEDGVNSDDPLVVLDDIYSFFNECFCLRDWVSQTYPELEPAIKKLFSVEGPLHFQLCADLSNAKKHQKLLKNCSRIIDHKRPLSDYVKQSVIGPTIYYWVVEVNYTSYDFYFIARECMKEWETFLVKNDLITLV